MQSGTLCVTSLEVGGPEPSLSSWARQLVGPEGMARGARVPELEMGSVRLDMVESAGQDAVAQPHILKWHVVIVQMEVC